MQAALSTPAFNPFQSDGLEQVINTVKPQSALLSLAGKCSTSEWYNLPAALAFLL